MSFHKVSIIAYEVREREFSFIRQQQQQLAFLPRLVRANSKVKQFERVSALFRRPKHWTVLSVRPVSWKSSFLSCIPLLAMYFGNSRRHVSDGDGFWWLTINKTSVWRLWDLPLWRAFWLDQDIYRDNIYNYCSLLWNTRQTWKSKEKWRCDAELSLP